MLILPPWKPLQEVLRDEPGCQRLNEEQRLAVQLSLDHHIVLIHGPPGTGKTTTATALMIVHAPYVNRILVVSILVDACEGRCVASVGWLFGPRHSLILRQLAVCLAVLSVTLEYVQLLQDLFETMFCLQFFRWVLGGERGGAS